MHGTQDERAAGVGGTAGEPRAQDPKFPIERLRPGQRHPELPGACPAPAGARLRPIGVQPRPFFAPQAAGATPGRCIRGPRVRAAGPARTHARARACARAPRDHRAYMADC